MRAAALIAASQMLRADPGTVSLIAGTQSNGGPAFSGRSKTFKKKARAESRRRRSRGK